MMMSLSKDQSVFSYPPLASFSSISSLLRFFHVIISSSLSKRIVSKTAFMDVKSFWKRTKNLASKILPFPLHFVVNKLSIYDFSMSVRSIGLPLVRLEKVEMSSIPHSLTTPSGH